MIRLTFKCRDCLVQFRIVVSEVPTSTLPPKYCLYCGSTNTNPSQDSEQDVWEVLSEGFGLPISLLQMFYSAWTQQPEGCIRFRDYLDKVVKQAMQEQPSEVSS